MTVNRHRIRAIDLGSAAADFIAQRCGKQDRLDPSRHKFIPKGNRSGRRPGSGSKKRVTLATPESLAKLLSSED